jgi:hypothetical protein
MTDTHNVRWHERFVQEWASRFGFLSVVNEPDSVESIDEVALILADHRSSLERHIDDLEIALKQCRKHVDHCGDAGLLSNLDELLKP